MIMTEKTKDFLHAIVITIAFIICLGMAIPGTIYMAIINKYILGTVMWALITIGGSCIFGYGTYVCWDEYKKRYKNK